MADRQLAPAGMDTSIPHPARVYDYILNGKDNFAADREAGKKLLEEVEDGRLLARAQRAFLVRVVRFMAQAGIRQFIDIGTGIPTSPNVHEVARGVDPTSRVVYVDFDPMVTVHNRALLATDDRVIGIEHDIRNPDGILDDPELRTLIDLDEPVGLIMLGVLHSVGNDDNPAGLIAHYRDRIASGSYLVIAQFSDDGDPRGQAQLIENYADTPWPMTLRPRAQLESFFDGFELVPPGLVDVQEWRPDEGQELQPQAFKLKIPGALGRKP